MKNARDVLVVDDEAVVLQGIRRICSSEGLSVDTAGTGREGLEQFAKATYRLIICDIMMGDVDGFEFLAKVRGRPHCPPIVMTTGYSTVENAVQSLQCGAVDYLAKPFTADELMAVVQRALNFGALAVGEGNTAPVAPSEAGHFHCLGHVSWARTEPLGTVLIGMNDTFVKTMKGLRSLELLPKGSVLIQGTCCATIVAADGLVHGLLCPVSGEVMETHMEAAARPAMIEDEPYSAGWLYRIIPTNLEHGLTYLTPMSYTLEPCKVPGKGELP